MNTSKKINEQIYKYTGVIFSLILIWTFLKHQEDLATENFLASTMMPILIARELIIMRKSAIDRPLLICTLILNLILLIPAFIMNYMIPLYKMDEYMYINKTIAIILIVTLPISFGVLYSQKESQVIFLLQVCY